MQQARPIDARPTPWKSVLLLCGKCARKMDGGFGPDGRDTLRTALRTELKKQGRRRDVRIVETKCLGLCPRKAVTLLDASRPGELLAVPRKTDASDVLARLQPARREG
jgi:predicted metal-binding protein